MSIANRAGQLLSVPAPAPAPRSPGPSPPYVPFITNTVSFQPTRVFTLAFFAIALVACIVLTMFITLTLMRRRRARLRYLSRSRMSTVAYPRRSVARPTQSSEAELPRVIPPLIEGVLVLHPNGEEQVAYPSDRARAKLVFEVEGQPGQGVQTSNQDQRHTIPPV